MKKVIRAKFAGECPQCEMKSHSGTVPAAVAAFFGPTYHPIVVAEFRPDTGWKRIGYRKRITPAWARKLAAEGVSYVTLSDGKREADFSVRECRAYA